MVQIIQKHMFNQWFNEIKWKPLLISTLLAFVICFISAFFLFDTKQQLLEYMLNNKLIDFPEPDDFESSYSSYMNAIYWLPFELTIIFLTNYCSAKYLIKRCQGNEYLNVAISVLLISVIIYQLEILSLGFGGVISFCVAYKARVNNK